MGDFILEEIIMSTTKATKNTSSIKNFTQKHSEILKSTPIVIVSNQNSNELRQPSLLKNVPSVTTYEVTSNIKERS